LKVLVDAYAGQILGRNETYSFCPPVPKTFLCHWPKISDRTVKIEEFAGYDS